jgi:hypothetical protein
LKGLPTELTDELEKEYAFLVHLFKWEASETIMNPRYQYYTDAEDDIWWDSHQWKARNIKFDSAQFSGGAKIDSIEVELDNVDGSFYSLYSKVELKGKPWTIYTTAIDRNFKVLGYYKLFVGFTDQMEIDVKKARISIYNHFIRWKMPTPRRTGQATCPWVFKKVGTCNYIGAENWCDHSWERCGELNNQPYFGGNRWLPYLADKSVWWGKIPKI